MKKALLGFVVVLALGVAWMAGPPEDVPRGMECSPPPRIECERVAVVVALTNIPRGKKITADMVRIVQVPISLRHSDAARDVRDVLDRSLLVNVYAREQILLQRIGEVCSIGDSPFPIHRGHRAVSIPMTMEGAAGGYVAPGRLVDVIGTFEIPAPEAASGWRRPGRPRARSAAAAAHLAALPTPAARQAPQDRRAGRRQAPRA